MKSTQLRFISIFLFLCSIAVYAFSPLFRNLVNVNAGYILVCAASFVFGAYFMHFIRTESKTLFFYIIVSISSGIYFFITGQPDLIQYLYQILSGTYVAHSTMRLFWGLISWLGLIFIFSFFHDIHLPVEESSDKFTVHFFKKMMVYLMYLNIIKSIINPFFERP